MSHTAALRLTVCMGKWACRAGPALISVWGLRADQGNNTLALSLAFGPGPMLFDIGLSYLTLTMWKLDATPFPSLKGDIGGSECDSR